MYVMYVWLFSFTWKHTDMHFISQLKRLEPWNWSREKDGFTVNTRTIIIQHVSKQISKREKSWGNLKENSKKMLTKNIKNDKKTFFAYKQKQVQGHTRSRLRYRTWHLAVVEADGPRPPIVWEKHNEGHQPTHCWLLNQSQLGRALASLL